MDDEDYSWVRRSRFSHSVVRSNSGREQFGAFIEQFNRGAAQRQRGRGSDSGFKLHGMNLQPATTTRTSASTHSSAANPPAASTSSSATNPPAASTSSSAANPPAASTSSASANPPIARTRSLDAKPSTDPSSSSGSKPTEHGSDRGKEALANGSNGVLKGANLFVDVSCAPEALQVPKVDSPSQPLDFSFHPDEQSMRLQRVCSSPSPFPAREIPAFDAPLLPPTRSYSLKVTGEERTPMLRARSPLPSRPIPELFQEAKSESKRFSTPPPRRKSLSPTRGPPPVAAAAAPVKAPGKVKHKKEHWDNAMARAAALKVLDRWTVDRSKLLIGPRFAAGAHSRLFNGIYMEVPVAVKFIRQPDEQEDAELALQLEKQFNTEIATLSRLQHRNVIKLIGACSSPPVFCVITEFLPGGSLRAFLHKQEHKSLPLDKIISVGLDIANGMAYIHSQGVVHRDVKPENIIFDAEWCAKIVDFGIACEEAYCDPLANDPGTFRWMAPEMMKHKPYGRKVDVYSFGLILWEMLTGSVPYEDLTPFQAAFAVFDKNVRPAIPSSCPAALRVLIEQCWALQVDKRPEFFQIVQLLEKFKMVQDRDGTLDNMPSSNCLETHDHKKWLANWVHKIKHHHHDFSGPPPPKLL
ncbi:serine/threonine-protein kinase A-Raf-like [Lolium rigidum]|uniref:serine/threonine-protein kinase A-Raf-like n=1 Tax=Lolium rigidum TaxID=89674 RepID=UPI001F5CE6F4|nr:serine/threonine-protein kinase A-Raf-like [Lolium rigidum]